MVAWLDAVAWSYPSKSYFCVVFLFLSVLSHPLQLGIAQTTYSPQEIYWNIKTRRRIPPVPATIIFFKF